VKKSDKILSESRKEWLDRQFSHWPLHMALSTFSYLVFLVAGGLLGLLFSFSVQVVAFATWFMIAGMAFALEFGQNQMKAEYGQFDRYDLLDSVYDWISWVFPVTIITVGIWWLF
jgi:hypothetical protein